MSRLVFPVFLFVILVITSQLEWRQPLVSDVDGSPSDSQKQQRISNREEAVKEKIILSQEKSIRKLSELARSLREQLLECRSNGSSNSTLSRLADNTIELEPQQILEE